MIDSCPPPPIAMHDCGHKVATAMPTMPHEILRAVTAWELRLLLDAAEGLTYQEIAQRRGRKPKTIERSFERLRDKLRGWGGGSKPGLVHWVDTNYDDWLAANGLPPRSATHHLGDNG